MELSQALIHMGYILDASKEVATAMQALRNAYTDDQWIEIEDRYPLIAELASACAGLEDCLDGNGP
jgi:hypothetical protein